MSDQTREQLNEAAAAAGVPAPETLPNKQAVVDALAAAQEPPARTFKLRDPAEGDENPVTCVAVGASPRVSLQAGETFTTTNAALADRLAGDELLEETTTP